MATELAKAYVQIIPSAKGINNAITKELEDALKDGEKKGSKFGGTLAKGIGVGLKSVGVLAGAAATTIGAGIVKASKGVLELSKNALTAYAETEQLVGGVETLFGAQGMSLKEYADSERKTVDEVSEKYYSLKNAQREVLGNAQEAYRTAGLSTNEYMETVTSFSAALVASLNGDTEAAAKKADQAIVDMSDNASKMGSDMESIQNAYQGFAKQNYTMLDNLKLGYGGTKEEMARLLEDATAISGIEYDISSYADVVDAIHVIQEEMGIAGTTAKEASETISGSWGMLQGAWSNLIAGLANPDADLGKLTQDVVDSAMTVVDNVLPVIQQMLPSIATAISSLMDQIAPMLPELINSVLPSLLEAVSSLLDGLLAALPAILQALNVIIPQIVDIIVNNLPAIMGAGLQIIVTLTAALLDNLPKLLESIPKIFKAMVEAFKTVDWKTIGKNIIEGIKEGLSKAWHLIIDWLKKKCGEMIDTVKSFFGIHSPSTVFRDQIGFNLAAGIGVGFADEMENVNKMIDDSLESEFDMSTNVNLASTLSKPQSMATKEVGNSGFNDLLTKLNEKLDDITNQQIVLDSGVLVGATAPIMNDALGRQARREAYA